MLSLNLLDVVIMFLLRTNTYITYCLKISVRRSPKTRKIIDLSHKLIMAYHLINFMANAHSYYLDHLLIGIILCFWAISQMILRVLIMIVLSCWLILYGRSLERNLAIRFSYISMALIKIVEFIMRNYLKIGLKMII